MSLHRARTPGPRHPGFDRRIVVPQPLSHALQYPQRTLCGALHPGLERRPLALADERGNILPSRRGRPPVRPAGRATGQRLGLARRALVLPSQPQPRPRAGRERRLPALTDRHQGPAPEALAGCHPLGLTQALGRAGDGGITAAVAPWRSAAPTWRASRQPACPRWTRSSWEALSRLVPRSARPRRSGKVRRLEGAQTVVRPMPSCRAMASPDHPWRCHAHTGSSVASRRARRWAASSPGRRCGEGGGRGRPRSHPRGGWGPDASPPGPP